MSLKSFGDWFSNTFPFSPASIGWKIGSGLANSAKYFANNVDLTGSQAQQREYDYNLALQQQAQAFNSAEAEKDRQFQANMSNTAYQRAFKDLEAAGYNPYIALTAGAASTPGGASASSSAASVSRQNNKLFEASYKLADSIIKAGQSSSASELSALTKIASLAILAL